MGIEGLKRQWGVHAAGVIMSSEPLADVIPLLKRPADGAMITQFDYPTCESLGLIKMDFLGLRNLTVLDDCVHNIEVNRGEKLVLEDLPLDDVESYQLLGTGNTLGVFQLDGGPMRSLLRLMRPDSFEDISAVLALYRPGPMGVDSHTNYALRKNGKQEINPVHRELAEPLAEILEPTYGLIVYQEQILAVAQKVAGYTLGQADLLRKAMGKKKKEILDAEYGPFSQGMSANGYSAAAIKALWDTLVPFSDYAFNKAHTAAYGLISYWTAYLKQHYAPEYMAALLTSVRDDKDKSGIYLNECRRMKIQVLPPDVNESSANFTPVGNDIRFGLTAIRNVGHNVVDGIVAARAEKGRYLDFNDFLEKVDALVCNKRVVESLIKAGAFDDMKHRRQALVAIHEEAVDQYVDVKRNEAIGQDSLFDDIDDTERLRRHGRDPRRHRRVGQDQPPRPRAGHARPLRLRPPAARPRARALAGHRLHHRPADARRGAAARHRPSPSAAWSPRCSARSPSAATPGRRSPSRTSTARSRCCCSPAPTSWPAPCSSRTPSSASRARSRATRTSPSCAPRRSPSPTCPTGPAGRS